MDYIEVIKYACIFFPFFALLFTTPFIILEYHKYGSISLFKSFIIYMFIFYIICAYFLVILPLPKIEEVKLMTTPRTQLIPFNFIIDFIKHTSLDITNTSTYITALKESVFFVPIYNIFLTIPFGMFLRYYFRCNMKQTIFYTFLLSLFFEITQLTGLYFIYPRGYRLFDVDDLILNTFGGLLGFIISKPIIKIIPSVDEIKVRAKEKGKIISGPRRSLAFIIDVILVAIIELPLIIIFNNNIINLIVIIIYYFMLPIIFKTSTPGQKLLSIEINDYNDVRNIKRIIYRKLIFTLIYIIIPIVTIYIISNIKNDIIRELGGLILILIYLLFYLITATRYIFTKKELLYEKISKTKLVSTIK